MRAGAQPGKMVEELTWNYRARVCWDLNLHDLLHQSHTTITVCLNGSHLCFLVPGQANICYI